MVKKILSEINAGIDQIKPLLEGETRIIAENQIIGLEEAKRIVEKYKDDGWIPADEPPVENEYVLLSFENFSLPLVGRYEDSEGSGMYYIGDCDEEDTCIANDLFVNAWMRLPELYRRK